MKPAPLFAPYVDLPAQNRPLREALLAAVARVLEHGQLILGPEVEALEERVAGYLGVPHVVGVGSGTDALVLALRARGIGAGHEVITTAHGFVATASAIALCGATPVFADIDRETMLLDPAAVARALAEQIRPYLI